MLRDRLDDEQAGSHRLGKNSSASKTSTKPSRDGTHSLNGALKKTLPGRVGREEGVGGGVAEGEDDGDVEEEERGRVVRRRGARSAGPAR